MFVLPSKGDFIQNFVGRYDENLKFLEETFNVTFSSRGNEFTVTGHEEKVSLVERIAGELATLSIKGYAIGQKDVEAAVRILSQDSTARLTDVYLHSIQVSTRRPSVSPKSLVQQHYIEAMQKYDLVFGIGPAGTGKTYLAMAMAISSLQQKRCSRIILTRPAVEAGEKLGFLPGDMYEKVNPYLRPLYDALYDMLDIDRVQKMIERGLIEIAPIAFMRGRTLNDSFVILDEAQNTSSEQMKMFLTRLGYDSKAVVTGDITQIDLPSDKTSGLQEVQRILRELRGVSFTYFSKTDVVRHKLVQDIIDAYDKEDARKQKLQKSERT
ncbi:phosphate starvation-inducible protein PhoH [candidate division KSB3 bacterium]|uniref:PhoH-like protein n=1 Tax=candidate division KSB3 bacterium TaxID=2044937 RepID=A0A2G6E1H2_9BACT|nr:MAG: phosphate starvation-inducible protein PhoH [candidate division KSB3 bacterium]PIE28541.1 MAG: phosphate starvation-inducible protein PhoH [candidate division KSB3 bacterium]